MKAGVHLVKSMNFVVSLVDTDTKKAYVHEFSSGESLQNPKLIKSQNLELSLPLLLKLYMLIPKQKINKHSFCIKSKKAIN